MNRLLLLIPVGLLTALPVVAQDVLGTLPSPTTATGLLSPAAPTTGTPAVLSPFVRGDVVLHPGLLFRYTYAGAINSAPGHTTNSYIQTYAPSLNLDIGTTVTAGYTATWTNYSNTQFNDSVDHLATLTAQRASTDLRLAFSQDYQSNSTLRTETGQQTSEDAWNTSLAGDLRLGTKASVSIDASQSLRSIDQSPDADEWTVNGLFNYDATSKVRGGIGLGMGYLSLDPGTDLYYFRPRANVSWAPTDRLQISLSGGEEIRKVYHSGQTAMRNPFYDGSLRYQPIEATRIELTVSRDISNSYFLNTVNERESWKASLDQRLLGFLYLSASYSDRTTDFITTQPAQTSRSDTLRNYEFALRTTLLTRLNLSAAYSYNWNESSDSLFGYAGKRITFTAAFSY